MINFDEQVRPFFQVLIKRYTGTFDTVEFLKEFKSTISDKNSKSGSYFSIQGTPDVYENYLAVHLRHKSMPTWLNQDSRVVSKKNDHEGIEDIENDLILVYLSDKHNYVFLHSNCSQVLSLLEETLDSYFESSGVIFNNLTAQKLNSILRKLELEFKTLGILNIFNAGGTAPEAKTYFARNTGFCLTPSFDSGFGFSYGLGSMKDDKDQKRPFGCSLKKSKIWSTWVDDIDVFIERCEEIVDWVEGKPKKLATPLDILVSPVEKKKLVGLQAVDFYFDSYAHEKGMVVLSFDSELQYDWHAFISDASNSVITFRLNPDSSKSTDVFIKYAFDTAKENFKFSYADPKSSMFVLFEGDNELDEDDSGTDLVKLLNKQELFTFIFEKGLAYRNKEAWEDNRLKQIFAKGSKEIDWSDVDIRKEDKKAVASGKKYNILEKVDLFFKGKSGKYISINDNGANEIADYIFLSEDQLILVHAKYSAKQTAGLRVDDLQVVSSQAIKNSKYFIVNAYTDDTFKRLYKNCNEASRYKNWEEFKKEFLTYFVNPNLVRECWIVQPGIDIDALTSKRNNKIHSLLNFVNSIFAVGQVTFKLVGS